MKQDDFGEKIRKIRKLNKDTLKSLAEKIQVDWSSLSKIERGDRAASVELLRNIIEVYEVNPNYFFGDNYTETEGHLLLEDDLNPSVLKEKYVFEIDGEEASEDEIKEAIRLIRYLRTTKED